MMIIMLYGFLGRQFGRVHHYDVHNPAEAIRALSVTLPDFRKTFTDGGHYRVVLAGQQELCLDQLTDPSSQRETLRIVPTISGAGGGFGQILLGAAIIAAAFYTGGASLAASGFGISTTFIGGLALSFGASLILGGVSQLLFKPKQVPDGTAGTADKPNNKPSFTFSGAVNTAAQGNPVPLLYGGPLIVGSQVISAGLAAEQIAVDGPANPTAPPGLYINTSSK
jgi:predicted phage tail protein